MEKSRRVNNEWKEQLRKRRVGKIKMFFSTFFVLMTFLSAAKVNAASSTLPGAATPGGALPNIQQPAISTEKTPSLTIPPLRERPLNAEEGPKILVDRFELEGAVERPGLISIAEVKDLLETQRKRWPTGMTMGQMQLVADEVTSYYRGHGLILARAYVAVQTVTSNIVTITILEGKLGAVHSETGAVGNLRYKNEMLEKPFLPLLGQAVVKDDLEDALYQLKDYPGLQYNAVINPGTAEGTADLYLNVTEERLFNAALSVDNYGSEYTGEYRPRLDLAFNNPTKAADKLQFVVLDTIEPNNELYGGVTYERPLPGTRNSMGIDYNKNTFDVGGDLEQLQLAGTTETRDIFIKHAFKRTRKGAVSCLIRFASLTTETTMDDVTYKKDDLSVLSAETKADSMDQWLGGGVTKLSVNLSKGFSNFAGSNNNNDISISRVGGSGDYAPPDFVKLNADFSRLQKLWTNASLLFRLKGQATDSMLVSMEQFAMGGPDTVRAYPQAEYLMDQGYFSSFEFIFNAPGFAGRDAFSNKKWGELLQVSIFYDTAAGRRKDPLPYEDESGYLSGAGVGVYFALPGRFQTNLSVAKPLGSHEAGDNRDYRTYFTLSCQY